MAQSLGKKLELDTDEYDLGSYAIRLNDENYEDSKDLLAEAAIMDDRAPLKGVHSEYTKYSEKLAEAIHNVIYDNEEVKSKIIAEFRKLMEEAN